MLGRYRDAMVFEHRGGARRWHTTTVNVKFTRGEGMGYLGSRRGHGCARDRCDRTGAE